MIFKFKNLLLKNPFFLEDVNTNNILVSTKFFLLKNKINTLLVTLMMIIKVNHYM